ncbi:MAG: universal stress protein [Candidatus Dadabacteria bacterium]|nr:universal stress protein [Candidatus Dadabacteria bacterium]NIS07331.1 universal stress protein [Candidatus Dadabacteria bacterium]NIV41275.1 universal stress protein [Candidatus Dadabacteria bacterium]NIX14510.1 universal stress protein [Candidatus Dadabacteria bacterium]NIY20968.1 universal stress protein [Candidatus Dadabacteria bacterium]
MYKLRNILWATDGSKQSVNALKYSKKISEKFNSKTIGIHVIRDLNKKIFDILNMKINFDEMIAGERDTYNKFFIKIEKEFNKQNRVFEHHITCGKTDEEILEYSNKNKIDLIVLGHKGSSSDEGVFSGSSTNKIVRSADIPVLVVNMNLKKRLSKIKRIVVPINLTEDLVSALDYAVFLASKLGAEISILYVQEFISYSYEMPIIILDDMKKYFDNKLNKLAKKYKNRNVKISTHVTEYLNPYMGILRHCEKIKPDLIVMNTHERKGLKKYFLGSITEKVINDMPCPVLTLKP